MNHVGTTAANVPARRTNSSSQPRPRSLVSTDHRSAVNSDMNDSTSLDPNDDDDIEDDLASFGRDLGSDDTDEEDARTVGLDDEKLGDDKTADRSAAPTCAYGGHDASLSALRPCIEDDTDKNCNNGTDDEYNHNPQNLTHRYQHANDNTNDGDSHMVGD